jgi:hypothetical protein
MWIFVLWVVTPCELVVVTSVSEEHIAPTFFPEDGNIISLRNVGIYMLVFTWSYNPEDQHRYPHRRENLKSHTFRMNASTKNVDPYLNTCRVGADKNGQRQEISTAHFS